MKAELNISILGAGESGTGAALLAQKLGHAVFLSDGKTIAEKYRSQLVKAEIEFEEGAHNSQRILHSDLVIKSPGIPEKMAMVQEIRKAGIELISEVEFAWRHCQGKVVAITGTNGKTTTTSLVHHIMKKAGLNCKLVGNVGKSFAGAVAEGTVDYYALEVSSFQLDDIKDFSPDVSILLNITPDHLERYASFDDYRQSKFRIFENQSNQHYFIYNADDEQITAHLPKNIKAQLLPISLEKAVEAGAFKLENNPITIVTNQESMNIDDLALQGKHNTYNSMAAGLSARLLGIRKETIRESLAGFESIEHRLEQVLQIYGMNFINDSKATNVNSTWYALESMQHPTIWIAGGIDKGNDYSQLNNLVEKKVKALICLGTDNSKLHKAFDDKIALVIDAANMDEAVRMAYKMGEKGDAVLLSPACASFDLFENYEDRGRQFKQAVRNL